MNNLRQKAAEIARRQRDEKQVLRDTVEEIQKGLSVLPDKEFWLILGVLSGKIARISKSLEDADIERAIHNFYCAMWEANSDDPDYIILMMRFAKTYAEKKEALYNPLFDVVDGSDDTFGDTIDSYPLAYGEERYRRALKGLPFEDAEQTSGEYSEIFNGENYITMRLFDAIVKRAADLAPDPADEERDVIDERPYEVTMTRTSSRTLVETIYAKNGSEAEKKANARIGDYDFNNASESTPEYGIEAVEEVRETA